VKIFLKRKTENPDLYEKKNETNARLGKFPFEF
jgi:hypothetical protein